MSKKPKRAPYRPEEEAYLKRWQGTKSAPSLWEKMDKDAKFNSQLRSRIEYDEDGYPLNEVTMSNRNSIGKTRGPRK
jgi:hypothetical protein